MTGDAHPNKGPVPTHPIPPPRPTKPRVDGAAAVPSPWMTVRETADYTRRHKDTVLRALREYQRTDGRSGLRGAQPKPHACYRVRRDDADRWMAGEPPARTRRLAHA
ncbi:hypothetical protein [Saccharopolyspora sp. NPDC050642]|uniref:hypothetical protein n=1 Tax=Saccharopolyspora sp. NPDC050642 TaxID=3157099 RepID=UPI0033F558F3